MGMQKLDITLLCKVVDNFGDIGVVFRLAKRLSFYKKDDLNLRLVVDDLKAFNLLCPQIKPDKAIQNYNDWSIYDWNKDKECLESFTENNPQVIIECFECGRPEWLEKLLFEIKIPQTTHIIMLDYLTAEDYAETFHCLKSLTRSAKVQKVNFMPGFTPKTGGLLLDEHCQDAKTIMEKSFDSDASNGFASKAVFFSYPRGNEQFSSIYNAFNRYCATEGIGDFNIKLAKGAGFAPFISSFNEYKNNCNDLHISVTPLSFLSQEEWDTLLNDTPLLFIRGEESLSRACLYGEPFVWHAYPQSEEYQLVKVQALLNRMKKHFLPEDYTVLEKCWISYNTTEADPIELEYNLYNFLCSYKKLQKGFKEFSLELIENGDLAFHLLSFINKTCIMK